MSTLYYLSRKCASKANKQLDQLWLDNTLLIFGLGPVRNPDVWQCLKITAKLSHFYFGAKI